MVKNTFCEFRCVWYCHQHIGNGTEPSIRAALIWLLATPQLNRRVAGVIKEQPVLKVGHCAEAAETFHQLSGFVTPERRCQGGLGGPPFNTRGGGTGVLSQRNYLF